MIDYETYCKIRQYHGEDGLSMSQIAAGLGIDAETVAKYVRAEKFSPRAGGKRASKLDAFKPLITRLLDRHPYTCTQILQRLREEGYEGGASILKGTRGQCAYSCILSCLNPCFMA